MRYGVLIALALAGCGGGDGGSDIQLVGDIDQAGQGSPGSAGGAAGLWRGTTDTGRTGAAILLSNGEYWFFYSSIGNSEVMAGAGQGTGNAAGTTFRTPNGRDFNLEQAVVESFSGIFDFVPRASLSGASTYQDGGAVNFTATYDDSFDLVPSLSVIAGDYAGEAVSEAGNESASFEISEAGAVTGQSSGGCSFSGTISPRTDGNVYNVSITFGAGPCLDPGETVRGIAYYDSDLQRLTSAGISASRTSGFIFLGGQL